MIGTTIKNFFKGFAKKTGQYVVNEGKDRFFKSLAESIVARTIHFMRNKILLKYVKKIIDTCLDNNLDPMIYVGEYLDNGSIDIKMFSPKYREVILNRY